MHSNYKQFIDRLFDMFFLQRNGLNQAEETRKQGRETKLWRGSASQLPLSQRPLTLIGMMT